MIQLISPGGAGKSTIGALLAERLDVIFVEARSRSINVNVPQRLAP